MPRLSFVVLLLGALSGSVAFAQNSAPSTPDQVLRTLQGTGVRYSERRRLYRRLERMGDPALDMIERAVRGKLLTPDRLAELVAVVPSIEAEGCYDLLRRILDFHLIVASEVTRPRQIAQRLVGAAEAAESDPLRVTWDALSRKARFDLEAIATNEEIAEGVAQARVASVLRSLQVQREYLLQVPSVPLSSELSFLRRSLIEAEENQTWDSALSQAQHHRVVRGTFGRLFSGSLELGSDEGPMDVTSESMEAALIGLSELNTPDARAVVEACDYFDAGTRMRALQNLGGEFAQLALIEQLVSDDESTSNEALGLLLDLRNQDLDLTFSALNDALLELSIDPEVGEDRGRLQRVLRFLMSIEDTEFGEERGELLAAFATLETPVARELILETCARRWELLSYVDLQEAVEEFLLTEEADPVRIVGVVERFPAVQDEAFTVPVAQQLLTHPDRRVQLAAVDALSVITGNPQTLPRDAARWLRWLEER